MFTLTTSDVVAPQSLMTVVAAHFAVGRCNVAPNLFFAQVAASQNAKSRDAEANDHRVELQFSSLSQSLFTLLLSRISQNGVFTNFVPVRHSVWTGLILAQMLPLHRQASIRIEDPPDVTSL